MQYAVCAASEALRDARWDPQTDAERQATGVAFGNGMSSTSEVADAAQVIVSALLLPLGQLAPPPAVALVLFAPHDRSCAAMCPAALPFSLTRCPILVLLPPIHQAEGKVRKLSPFFVPRILANMAAGAISIRWVI